MWCVLSFLVLLSCRSHVLHAHLHVHIPLDVHFHIGVHVGVTLFAHFLVKKRSLEHLLSMMSVFSKPLTFHNGFMFFAPRSLSNTFRDFKPYLICKSGVA